MSERWESLQHERILVTGSGGVLGSAILRLLRSQGIPHLAPARAQCDLLDAGAVRATWDDFKPTVVLHLAGWVAGVQGNLSFAGRAFYENTCINVNVIEASRLAGVRKIVAAGTTAVYSDEIALPMREADIWRGAPHGSEAAYAHSKRAMLAQLEAYHTQYGIDFGYMICTNLYGPGDRFDEKYGHVVPSLIARFERAAQLQQPEIVIWGDGTPTRDFLFSEDAARAFLTVAETGRGAFNTATGSTITIRELVEILRSVSGYRGEVVWDTTKPKGQQARSYDNSRLLQLGWEPQTRLPEGIAQSFEWYQRNIGSVRR
jgi:GDP-L-fucose synthase